MPSLAVALAESSVQKGAIDRLRCDGSLEIHGYIDSTLTRFLDS
jgi:hypothetical protein